MYYVCVLKCLKTNQIYIGYAGNLRQRIIEHNTDHNFSTRGREWALCYYEAYRNKNDAQIRERRIKNYGKNITELKKRIKFSLNLDSDKGAG